MLVMGKETGQFRIFELSRIAREFHRLMHYKGSYTNFLNSFVSSRLKFVIYKTQK